MTWITMLGWSAVALNMAVCGWNLLAVVRANRLIRHAYALDELLAKLCVQAYANQHRPIWAAWTAVMGEISVEITQNRRMPKAD